MEDNDVPPLWRLLKEVNDQTKTYGERQAFYPGGSRVKVLSLILNLSFACKEQKVSTPQAKLLHWVEKEIKPVQQHVNSYLNDHYDSEAPAYKHIKDTLLQAHKDAFFLVKD